MKTIILSAIAFLTFLAGYTQELVKEGKKWSQSVLAFEPGKFDSPYWGWSYYLQVGEDTLIEGKQWYKLNISYDEYMEEWEARGYIYEEENKVYYMWPPDVPEKLLYDFTLEKGDSIEQSNGSYALVDSVYIKTTFDDQLRKHIHLSGLGSGGSVTWIEGLGSDQGLLETDAALYVGGVSLLLCCEEDGVFIYNTDKYGLNTCFYVAHSIYRKIRGCWYSPFSESIEFGNAGYGVIKYYFSDSIIANCRIDDQTFQTNVDDSWIEYNYTYDSIQNVLIIEDFAGKDSVYYARRPDWLNEQIAEFEVTDPQVDDSDSGHVVYRYLQDGNFVYHLCSYTSSSQECEVYDESGNVIPDGSMYFTQPRSDRLLIWKNMDDSIYRQSFAVSSKEVQSGSKLYIYPNPVANNLTIEYKEPILQLDIFDPKGVCVKSIHPMTCSFNLRIGDFKPGVFIVSFVTKNNVYRQKIIKK